MVDEGRGVERLALEGAAVRSRSPNMERFLPEAEDGFA